MRLIITRPAAQAGAWVAELLALGHDAAALPLIEIGPPADPAPVLDVWRRLAPFSLVMFVSANAVQQFFALAAGGWPAGLRAGSTGPGTSAALRRAGVPPAAIVEPAADAPVFDSEALWAQLAREDWAGRRVLVVRGEDGRDWLADTLRGRGALVEFVAAYQRRPPQLDATTQALLQQALAAPQAHTWLFSSSEAVGHLRQLAPGADWSTSRALASHPRIAQAACAAGFGDVHLLTAPTAEAVSAWVAQGPSIQSAAS
jgi:uroporphyrinogen-III synthase